MKIFLIILFFLIYNNCLLAQKSAFTIPEYISQETNDSLRMELLLEEGYYNSALSFERRIAYLGFAKDISKKKKHTERTYYILSSSGDLYSDNESRDTAILLYKQAIRLKEVKKLAIPDFIYSKCHNALSACIQDHVHLLDTSPRALLETAVLHSKISVKLNPDFANAWLLLGNANIKLANTIIKETKNSLLRDKKPLFQKSLLAFEAAIIAYKNVLKIRPYHPDIKRNFGILYRDRGRLLGQYLGQLDESIYSLEMSLDYNEKGFETLRLLGIANGMKGVLLQKQNLLDESKKAHYQAIRYLKKALKLQPNSVPILYNIMVAYFKLDEDENAKKYKEKWKAINPDYDPSN